MDIFKIITSNGIEKDVDGIFYLYNSKYFFAYTEKEFDEKGYVIFNLVQVGKEIKNTDNGPMDTGYMIGMEISDAEEWKKVQASITKIVDDKKNGTQSNEIQYLPQNMLNTLKIMSSKTFKLSRDVVEKNFKINLPVAANDVVDPLANQLIEPTVTNSLDPQPTSIIEPVNPIEQEIIPETVITEPVQNIINGDQISGATDGLVQPIDIFNNNVVSNESYQPTDNNPTLSNDVIIDYKARFFEEQEKNKELEEKIKELQAKLENIKNILS